MTSLIVSYLCTSYLCTHHRRKDLRLSPTQEFTSVTATARIRKTV